MKSFKIGGIHPPDTKFSADIAISKAKLPKEAVVLLTQQIGAPAKAIVKRGDVVKVGQLIAEKGGFVSSNIHSPVSGKVKKIDTAVDVMGNRKPAIYITVEGDEWLESIDASDKIIENYNFTPEEIIKKIEASGIVGMGGASFPTQVKLSPPPGKIPTILIINAVECEPYLTADYRLLLEKSKEIFIGVKLLMKAIKVDRAVIGIENNKPKAIEKMQKISTFYPGIEIMPLKMKYPQGGEKQLIDAVIGKRVPSGALPIETGAIVQNVGTVFAVYEAIEKNKPLFERIITVTGKNIPHRANLLARIGTPMSDLIASIEDLSEDCGKAISGGPMMGKALKDFSTPMTKGSSGLLLVSKEDAKRKEAQNCIRCGKCIEACPMGLEPYLLMNLSDNKGWEELEDHHIMDCIECGCCTFSCPSNRPLLDYLRLGKNKVGGIIRSRKK